MNDRESGLVRHLRSLRQLESAARNVAAVNRATVKHLRSIINFR